MLREDSTLNPLTSCQRRHASQWVREPPRRASAAKRGLARLKLSIAADLLPPFTNRCAHLPAEGRTSYHVRSSGRRTGALEPGRRWQCRRRGLVRQYLLGPHRRSPENPPLRGYRLQVLLASPFYDPRVDEAFRTCAIEAMKPPRPVGLQQMHVVACYLSHSILALPRSELWRKHLGLCSVNVAVDGMACNQYSVLRG